MSRGLSSPQVALTTAPHRIVFPLFELLFDSGALRLAIAPWDVVVGSDTYISTGGILKVDPLRESATTIEGMQLTMSGLDAAIIVLATSEPYQGRPMRILKAFVNPDTNAVVGTPGVPFLGRMRAMTISEQNDSATVVLSVEHYDADFDRPWPLRYSNSDQLRLFPGDKGCEYAEVMTEKSIVWPAKEAFQR